MPAGVRRSLLLTKRACPAAPQVGAVVVSPTRELARQILVVAQPYVATVPWLRAILLVGGT